MKEIFFLQLTEKEKLFYAELLGFWCQRGEKGKWAIEPSNLSVGRTDRVHAVLPYHFSMKRLRHGELRDLTCPRHRVVYWESCQKHFPTPHTELCISACCYHSLLKINTNTAQTQRSLASMGTRRQDDFKVEIRIGEEQRTGMVVCCDSSHKLCMPFGMRLLSNNSLLNEWMN